MDSQKNNHFATIESVFFNRDALLVARQLLGKVIRVRQANLWLQARIIETEAYYLEDKASHASLGITRSRNALFMSAGTLYMYYSRGGDSLNFSCQGQGNAVLIKSGYPVVTDHTDPKAIRLMQTNNPSRAGTLRPIEKLCSGQTLLCKALDLRVPDWNGKKLSPGKFELVEDGYIPDQIIQTTRLGINPARDAHLPYRFVDAHYAKYCTKNPLSVRNWQIGHQYTIFAP
ncbi:MAG: DNA-3-methyladenine glycosylase [Candidatus Marinimicrobia bacterium]|nr:DNA-3-methyladenine glycosylase [Candidatus Neomarinimicrobiota bacterium]